MTGKVTFRNLNLAKYGAYPILLTLMCLASSLLGQPLSGIRTVGPTGNYPSITAAYADLKVKGAIADVVFELQPAYTSSSESFPITFGTFNSITGLEKITFRPAAAATNLTISSASSTATILFDEARNIVFDGRSGGNGGKNLTIANTSSTGRVLSYINLASKNAILYCNITGSATNTNPTIGVIFFGPIPLKTTCCPPSNPGDGNDSNTIDHCDISGGPSAIVSSGINVVEANYNSGMVITNNNIFNFTNTAASESNGIKISQGSQGWTITGNSFYQTTTPTVPSGITHQLNCISIANEGFSYGYTINNNYFGGRAPLCGGQPWFIGGNPSNGGLAFQAIYIATDRTRMSTITGNTIANFDLTNARQVSYAFMGVHFTGKVDVTNNTFGSMTQLGSIRVRMYGNGDCGMIRDNYQPFDNHVITGNKLGGIELYGNAGTSTSMYLIQVTPSSVTAGNITVSIDRNELGNSLASNILLDNPVATIGNSLIGIYAPEQNVHYSIQSNLIRNFRNTSPGQYSDVLIDYFSGVCQGIHLGNTQKSQWSPGLTIPIDTIAKNQISGLFGYSGYQFDSSMYGALAGIVNYTEGFSRIEGNRISNLYLLNDTGATNSSGIAIKSRLGTFRVQENIINGISARSAKSTINGVHFCQLYDWPVVAQVYNNMIRIGLDSLGNSITKAPLACGVYKHKGILVAIGNTILMAGTGVDSSANGSHAIYLQYGLSDTLVNNQLINFRSNQSTGSTHHALSIAVLKSPYIDYNNLFANGTGGYLGNLAGNNAGSIQTWRSMTGLDIFSSSFLPSFITPFGNSNTMDLHLVNTVARGKVWPVVSRDIDGDKRSRPPEIGADEIPIDLGVVAIDSPTLANYCGVPKDVYVRIKNFGIITATYTKIICEVNDSVHIKFNWTGSLGPGATSPPIKIGMLDLWGGVYKAAIYTSDPNGLIDNTPENDTSYHALNVTRIVFPTLSASSEITGICTGMPLTFRAKTVWSGNAPTFQWKLNGNNVGTNDSTFTTSSLNNNDSVWVVMTSGAPCAVPATLTSNSTKITVGNNLEPDVILTTPDGVVCDGKPANFRATPVNCGYTPHYQWFKNDVSVGKDSSGYQLVLPANGDQVKCVVSSSLPCVSRVYDTSSTITVQVNPILVPTVTVSSTKSDICAGDALSFSSVITNPGATPNYRWRSQKTGVVLDSGVSVTNYSGITDGDSIYLVMISSATCATPQVVMSNKIGIKVNPIITPTASIVSSVHTICPSDSAVFTGTFSGGGNAPVYQWYRNNTLVQTGGTKYTAKNIGNLDSFYVKYTSNAICLSKAFAVSNSKIVTVLPLQTPDVTISASNTTVCSGSNLRFTANATQAGFNPHYLWKKNQFFLGDDAPVLITNALANNDTISVIILTSANCPTKLSDTSSKIVIKVNPVVLPEVTINAPSTTFCENTPMPFTATLKNSGLLPVVKWMRNNIQVGTNSSFYTPADLVDKDTIYALLYSTLNCAVNPDTSNKMIMLQVPTVVATVSITPTATNICSGTPVTFTTAVGNAGSNPSFQWKVHGTNAGTDSSVYTTAGLNDNDTVWVEMSSSINCAIPNPVISNKVIMSVQPSYTPSVSVSTSKDTACNGEVITFTATDVNGGNPPVHQWLKNDFPAGSNSNTFSTNMLSTDLVKCVLITNLTCATKLRDTATAKLKFRPAPVKPKVTRTNDTLYSTVGPAYQWYVNSSELPGENKRYMVVYHNGSFKVGVDSAGCRSISNPYNVTHFVGLDEQLVSTFSIGPNPGTGSYVIYSASEHPEPVQINVFDPAGRLILEQKQALLSSANPLEVNLPDAQAGIYLIRLISHESVFTAKVILEK